MTLLHLSPSSQDVPKDTPNQILHETIYDFYLFANRKGLVKMLLDIYLGLSVPRNYEAIANQVHNIVQKYEYYDFLNEDEAKNRT